MKIPFLSTLKEIFTPAPAEDEILLSASDYKKLVADAQISDNTIQDLANRLADANAMLIEKDRENTRLISELGAANEAIKALRLLEESRNATTPETVTKKVRAPRIKTVKRNAK